MRKRSVAVVFGALAVAGVAGWKLIPESEPEYSQACVNQETQVRVEDEECEEDRGSGYVHRWFYSPRSHPVPAVGSKMDFNLGSYTKPSGSISTVSRGGFGGRASSTGS